jgi:hypothetical protein
VPSLGNQQQTTGAVSKSKIPKKTKKSQSKSIDDPLIAMQKIIRN